MIDTDRANIDKIAQSPEDKLLLARLWDKINAGIRRNTLSFTGFLSPREQNMACFLFGSEPGLCFFGGYGDAERKMLFYLPDYLSGEALYEEDSPIVCLRAVFYDGDSPSHRDFLGGLMGCRIARETVGDICVGNGSCDFFVTAQIADFITQNLESVGRTHLKLRRISLTQAQIPEPAVDEIKDTLASVRLDAVIAAGFRISRSLAAQHICAGRAAIDGLPCDKPDKPIAEGMKISLRGFGKIKVKSVSGQTKKGRTWVILDRYV